MAKIFQLSPGTTDRTSIAAVRAEPSFHATLFVKPVVKLFTSIATAREDTARASVHTNLSFATVQDVVNLSKHTEVANGATVPIGVHGYEKEEVSSK